ncbi:rod shape-determining protein MreD [uncultured Roseovarius sp.]|uniref:rod shape-determining protein MreD n=1 Tax=uncultured Roseovarius sp. TaxID=293344 RepID=UPI002636DAA1|nr:rod shape-determining protein MreD [uncultured Roseovarius sp.]
MANARRPWIMRSLFFLVCMVLLFVQLLPLDTVPKVWAAPELIVAVTFAWVIRRPEFAPAALIALIFLLADLLVQRPPGLWAALVLLGSETLRNRAPGLRDLTFPVEWLTVCTTLVIMTLGYRVILGLTVVDQAPLGLSLIQLVMTLVAYPIVVLVTQSVFGVRKRVPGDRNGLGHQI